jgi:hypothetical protein
MGCFFSVFYAIDYYNGILSFTYMIAVWDIWFKEYIINALFMASTGFEIAATFSCSISIEKKMKWCEKRISFWIWLISILLLSFAVEIFLVFMFNSNYTDEFNRTTHRYVVSNNSLLSKSDIFGLIESIILDIIFLLI